LACGFTGPSNCTKLNCSKTDDRLGQSVVALLRNFGGPEWTASLKTYLVTLNEVKREISRHREMARIPVTLPGGKKIALSPGGQNPLIKAIIEDFCPRFAPGGVVLYIGDTENKFVHLEAAYLAEIGIALDCAAKMPVNGGRKLERWAVEKRSTLPNVLLPGGMSIPLFSMVI